MRLTRIPLGSNPCLLIHGGAGALREDLLSEADRVARLEGLRLALAAGWQVLTVGSAALDAVQAAVEALEDHPCYNAGRGSVLNERGEVEMDASLMCGATLRAGALCGVKRLRHPIRAARRLLEAGRVLAGPVAEEWLEAQGEEVHPPEWFVTAERRRQLEVAREVGAVRLDHDSGEGNTVGAVARDAKGDLAAATSTGGMTNKPVGRIGDSPVIGAGTYADNASVALSATGAGEAFLRVVFAHEVESRVRLLGQPLDAAIGEALARVASLGGDGGCIALGSGQGVLAFNSQGMYRAWVDPVRGVWSVAIFDEVLTGGALRELLES